MGGLSRLIARVTAVAVVASTGAVITHQSVSAADPTVVQGVVTDMTIADGAEGVAVQVMTGVGVEQKPTTVAEVLTDDSGFYSIDVTAWDDEPLHLNVVDPTRRLGAEFFVPIVLTPETTNTVNPDLDLGGVINGSVRNQEWWWIEDACATITDLSGEVVVPYEWIGTCSGEWGWFQLPALPPGDYLLDFGTPSPGEAYPVYDYAVTAVAGEQYWHDVIMPLPPGTTISAAVTDGTDPVDDVRIVAHTTDRHGEFRARDMEPTGEPGEYSVYLGGIGFGSEPFTVDALSTSPSLASDVGATIALQPGYDEAIGFTLQPGSYLEGEITGPDDEPVSGACVVLEDLSGEPVLRSDHAPCTDETGTFATYSVPAGTYQARVVAPDGLDSRVIGPFTITPGSPAFETVQLDEFPPTLIAGLVRDEVTEQPLPDVRVKVRGTDSFGQLFGQEVVTGADGQYELDLTMFELTGDALIVDAIDETGTHAASLMNEVYLQHGYTELIGFDLDAGGRFVGDVTDVSTGFALEGACVRVYDATGTTLAVPSDYSPCTGTDGRFETVGLAPGDYVLEFVAPFNYETLTTTAVTIVAGSDTEVDGELAPVVTGIEGLVVEQGTTTPIEGVTVAARVETADGEEWLTTSTDVDGEFAIDLSDDLPVSTVLLDAVDPDGDYASVFEVPLDVQQGYIELIEIGMEPGGTIEGTITTPAPDLLPIEGACVTVRNDVGDDVFPAHAPVCSDENGDYATRGLPAGDYTLDVVPPSNVYLGTTDVPATITSGVTTLDIELEARPPATISGYVTDNADEPVFNARVRVRTEAGAVVAETYSDNSGFYIVTVAEGTYELVVGAPNGDGEFVPAEFYPFGETTKNIQVGAFTYPVSGELLLGGERSRGSVSCGETSGSVVNEWVFDPELGYEVAVPGTYAFEVVPGTYDCAAAFYGDAVEGDVSWNFTVRDTVSLEVSGPTSYDVAVDDVVELTVSVVDGAGVPVSSVSEVQWRWNAPWVWDPETEMESYAGVPVAGSSFEVVRANGWSYGESSAPVFTVPDGLTDVFVEVYLANGLYFEETIDINGDTGAILYLIDPGIWFVGSSGDSFDDDNVDDITEALAPNQGDGNNDGFPDYDQNNVTSLPSYTGNYVTVEVENGKTFTNVRAVDPVADVTVETPVPSSYTLPEGLLDFRIDGLAPGETVDVIIYTESVEGVTGYAKYDRETKGWYQLPSELVDIVESDPLHPERGPHVIVSLTDGGDGDDDGLENGTIIDPGGLLVQAPIDGDETAPVVTGTISPAPNVNGWNSTPVTVSWVGVDEVSGATQPAPTPVTDTGITTVTSGDSCDESGNCGEGVVIVKVDTAAPTIDATVTPAPNAAGWNNTPVTVSYACDDDLSGVTFCSDSDAVDGEGADQSVIGFANDAAGNTANASTSVSIDTTAPVITCGAPITVGRGSTSTLEATVFDELSGVASPTVAVELDTSTVGTFSAGVTATDIAGNPATTACEYTVEVTDESPPTVAATYDPAPNAAGWNNETVTVSFECTDDESDVATCPDPVTFDTEGADQQETVIAGDGVGNEATLTVSASVDLTDPAVTVGGVDGGPFSVSTPPTPSCSTTDGLSGVAVDATMTVTGGNEHGVGTFTVTCSGAVDNAGNTGSATATYEVRYDRADGVFTGGPVVAWDVDEPVTNTGRRGRTYPMEWELYGADGALVADLDAVESVIAYRSVNCDSAVENDVAESSTTLTESLKLTGDGAFHLNWKSPKQTGCYVLVVSLDDGSLIQARFQLT